jgi:hypothetical protein
VARLAGELSYQDPVGIRAGMILVHLVRIEPDYAKCNLISKNNICDSQRTQAGSGAGTR